MFSYLVFFFLFFLFYYLFFFFYLLFIFIYLFIYLFIVIICSPSLLWSTGKVVLHKYCISWISELTFFLINQAFNGSSVAFVFFVCRWFHMFSHYLFLISLFFSLVPLKFCASWLSFSLYLPLYIYCHCKCFTFFRIKTKYFFHWCFYMPVILLMRTKTNPSVIVPLFI